MQAVSAYTVQLREGQDLVNGGMSQHVALQNEQLGYWNTLWVMLLDIYVVLTGPEKRAVRMALWLAFFDQGCASTAIINYAPEVLEMAGIRDYGDATLWSSAITAAKVVCPPHSSGRHIYIGWSFSLYILYGLKSSWLVTFCGSISLTSCTSKRMLAWYFAWHVVGTEQG